MGAAASDYLTPYADVQYGFLDDELGIVTLHALAAKGDFHRVSMCLKKGLDPNRPSFDDDDDYAREDTPLICAARGTAARRGRKRHLKTLDVLLRFGGDVNKHNYLEQTPLYVACEKNLLPVVQWLVTHGADANKSSKVGVSPLLCAYRNGNAEIVQLLLDHGAKVVDPPKGFCSIQFPTIAKELRGENVDRRDDSDSDHSDSSSGRDSDEVAAPPVDAARPMTSYLRLRSPWRATTPGSSLALPSLSHPTTRPSTAKPRSAAAGSSSDPERMRAAIELQQQRQQQQRDEIRSELNEVRRLDEQREYREKLAVDNATRKAQRRLKRDKATYDKYVARVEQKRREHTAPLRATPSYNETRRSGTAPTLIGLHWSRHQDAIDNQSQPHHQQPRTSLHTAPSRMGRPTWVAQPVYTTQVAPTTAASHQDGDETLLRESRAVFDALQVQHDRRERLREAYAMAPAARSPAALPLSLPAALPSLSRQRPETAP